MKFQRFVWFFAISFLQHVVTQHTIKQNTQNKMDTYNKNCQKCKVSLKIKNKLTVVRFKKMNYIGR